jgi:pimeloyl-ACP methyl ester carboxylesterase
MLIVLGGREDASIAEAARPMHATMSGSLEAVPDAGHFAQVENPAVFNRELFEFLKTL